MNSGSHTEIPPTDGYARFRVGQGLAIFSAPTFILVDPANGAFAERLWALLEAGSGIDALLEELSAVGLQTLGDFAMCQFDEDELRVVVRGQAQALVVSGDETFSLEPGSAKTWVEAVFSDASSFALGLGELAGEELVYRMDRGIAPADQLHWGEFRDAEPQLRDLELGWVDEFDPVDVGRDRSQPDTPASIPTHQPADDAQRVAVEHAAVSEPTSDDESDADYDFDALYGRTVAKTVLGAAVAGEPEQLPAANGSHDTPDSAEAVTSGNPAERDRPLSPPESADKPPGLIDTVPGLTGSTRGAGAAPPTLAGGNQLGDHDGMTISMEKLQEMRQASDIEYSDSEQSPGSAASVQALVCPDGHPNPTHADTCMRCSSDLNGPPQLVARPSLGRLVFSTGRVVELDRPAIIGRNPRVDGSLQSEMPQLVQFADEDLLSRSHAMIHVESWHVLVEDLGSRNGTIISPPGREPRLLMAREPVILEPGSVIELADEVSATYHGME